MTPAQQELFPIPSSAVDKMILKSALRFYTTAVINLPKPILERYFSTYFLLYWEGSYILDQMQGGYITRNEVSYKVVFQTKLSRGKILARKREQFALSFRTVNPSYPTEIEPTVIIFK